MRLSTKILLALAIVSLFSFTGVAFAQSSGAYDLGCWGVMLAGGGVQPGASNDYRMIDSMGYWATGTTVSSAHSLRPGYIQDWAVLETEDPPPVPPPTFGSSVAYAPLVSNVLRFVRTCPW